jgi:protein gp37
MLTKSGIEYLNYHWGFMTGCKHGPDVCPCSNKCWARSMAHRYKRSFEPTLHAEKLLDPLKLKKPSRIGVCFTGDLFGEWVNNDVISTEYVWGVAPLLRTLKETVFKVIDECPQHQFFFLTKNPKGLLKWGKFPDNCNIGFTANNQRMFWDGVKFFDFVKAKVKYISIEPLMSRIYGTNIFTHNAEPVNFQSLNVQWLIIGGWSTGKVQPKIEWVKEIVEAADKAGIPVWLKDNVTKSMGPSPDGSPLYDYYKWAAPTGSLRQELPEVKK